MLRSTIKTIRSKIIYIFKSYKRKFKLAKVDNLKNLGDLSCILFIFNQI